MICPDCALTVPDSAPDCPICGHPFAVAEDGGTEDSSIPENTATEHVGRSIIRIRRGTVERFRRNHSSTTELCELVPPPLKSAITKANPRIMEKAEAFLDGAANAALRRINLIFKTIGRGISVCWDAIDETLWTLLKLDTPVGTFIPKGWTEFDRDAKAAFSSHGWRIVRGAGAVVWRIIRTLLLLGLVVLKTIALIVLLIIVIILVAV